MLVSVQAYFALKLAGHDATESQWSARESIRKLGAPTIGQFDSVLPRTSQLTTTIASRYRLEVTNSPPMSIVWSSRPVRKIAIERGVRELFVNKPCDCRIGAGSHAVDRGFAAIGQHRAKVEFRASFSDLVWHIIAIRQRLRG